MSGQRQYLVLGTGVGRAIAWWLIQQKDTARVIIADTDYTRAEEVAQTLGCTPRLFDVERFTDDGIRRAFQHFSVVISAIPARYNPRLAKLAIDVGTSFCDLGGVLDVTRQMQCELDEPARTKGVSVIPDCGLMPGLGVILAKDLLEHVKKVEDLTIYVGGIPQRPQPQAGNYQKIFSIEGLLHILEPAPILRKGLEQIVPAFSEREYLTAFGQQVEAFITAGASVAHEYFRDRGVQNFCEKTVRWPGFPEFIASIPHDQLASRLEQVLPPTNADHPDLVWMRIIACSERESRSWELLDRYDPALNFSAMARTTGFSAAATAVLVARGSLPVGVHTPENAFTLPSIGEFLELLEGHLDLQYAHL